MTTPQNAVLTKVSQAYLDELAILEEDMRTTQDVLADPSCFDSVGALVDFEDHALRTYAAKGLELIGVIRVLCEQQPTPIDAEQDEAPAPEEISEWFTEWDLENGEPLGLGEEVR